MCEPTREQVQCETARRVIREQLREELSMLDDRFVDGLAERICNKVAEAMRA